MTFTSTYFINCIIPTNLHSIKAAANVNNKASLDSLKLAVKTHLVNAA